MFQNRRKHLLVLWENHLIKSYTYRITMRSRRGWTTLLLQNRRSFASWNANTTTIDSSALIYLGAAGSNSSSSSSLSHRHQNHHHHLRKVGRSRNYASDVSEERKRARNIGISAFFALSFILSALVFVVLCSFLFDRYRFLDILTLFLREERAGGRRECEIRRRFDFSPLSYNSRDVHVITLSPCTRAHIHL